MNLIVDVGNTNTKVAVFDKDQLIWSRVIGSSAFKNTITKLNSKHPIDQCILATVARSNHEMISFLKKQYATLILNSETLLPFRNNYSTPATLGVDRMGLVAAFAKAYPNKNGLIIDAGTCITYDFLDAEMNYWGGAITPGLRLRYQSLNDYTARLPLLEPKLTAELTGDSTENSIHVGISGGVVKEIDGTIGAYREQYPELITVLTGGDADRLSKQLKNGIFAHSNFLLEGLNYILEFNKNE